MRTCGDGYIAPQENTNLEQIDSLISEATLKLNRSVAEIQAAARPQPSSGARSDSVHEEGDQTSDGGSGVSGSVRRPPIV